MRGVHRVPVGWGELGKWFVDELSGIIDQGIQVVGQCADLMHSLRNAGLRGDINTNGNDLARMALLYGFYLKSSESCRIAGECKNGVAVMSKEHGECSTDSGGATGYCDVTVVHGAKVMNAGICSSVMNTRFRLTLDLTIFVSKCIP